MTKGLFGLKFFITQNSSLNFRHSSLITLHSSPKNITISDNFVCGLFGLKFLCMFSIPWLTFMSTHWVPQYQLKICRYRTVSFLPAFSLSLSLSLLHAHSTPKTIPNIQKPKIGKIIKIKLRKTPASSIGVMFIFLISNLSGQYPSSSQHLDLA